MTRFPIVLALVTLTTEARAQIRVDPMPELVVSATTPTGELRFSTASWATRLASGEIAVADVSESVLRILGPDGALRRTLGRRGAGPGEYRLPVWVGRCRGDSLYVWDAAARLTAYSPAAAGNEQPTTRTIAAGASSVSAACSSNGSLAIGQMMRPRRDVAPALTGESPHGGQFSVVEMVATLAVVSPEGGTREVRADFSQGQWAMGRLSPNGGMGGLPRPLSTSSSYAYSGRTLIIADAASAIVTGVGEDGRETFRFAVSALPVRTSAADYRRAVQPAVAIVPAAMRDAAAELLLAIPHPPAIPPFWRVLVDSEGLIWLVVSAEGATETRFRVYNQSGTLVAQPRFAGSFVPFEVGKTQLLGKRENADGEDEIVILRVSRAF